MEHFDVVIVGAGLSGIGAGVHLSMKCPDRKFLILESRAASGGTWDLFRYPGIRSDSDMFTFGYTFKPWLGDKRLADGPSILSYIRETAREYQVDEKIRYNHKVVKMAYSSKLKSWTVTVDLHQEGKQVQLSCSFLFLCAGYYKYESGYSPIIPGEEKFNGLVIHPQKWPEDLDYSNKRVVVIGSGATAVTLVPAMTDKASHVIMLQRTPTYILSLPARDTMAIFLYKILPIKLAYWLVRWKNIFLAIIFYSLSQKAPGLIKQYIFAGIRQALGRKPEVLKQFTPPYNPWEQRVCLVPDEDFFMALKKGRSSVVTGHIDTFTPTGLRLKSGEEIPADIVVKATGLELQMMSQFEVEIDGKPLKIADQVIYRGVMLSNLPNLAFIFGYLNASWTLKADLACEYLCRLLNEMKAHGYHQVVPVPPKDLKPAPFTTFSSGYLQRAMDQIPKQSCSKPWIFNQNYILDIRSLKYDDLNDRSLVMSV